LLARVPDLLTTRKPRWSSDDQHVVSLARN
jgi:hypothetical protein